eukprot:7932353-Ditylum_brightwellii.AAC.1
MKAFASAGFTNKELAVINRCCLFSRVATLLDITSGDGKYIIADTLHGQRIRTHFEYIWPHQGTPSTAEWKVWQQAIETTFEKG